MWGFLSPDGWRRISISSEGSIIIHKDLADGTKGAVTISTASPADWNFANFNGIVFGCNGHENAVIIDQYGIMPMVTNPPFKYVVKFGDYLLGSGAKGRAEVYWSGLGVPGNWPLFQFNPVGSASDQHMGLAAIREFALILKRNSLYIAVFSPVAQSSNPFVWRRVASVGCIAPKSIAGSEDMIYFLGEEFPFRFSGGSLEPIMVNSGIEDIPLADRQKAVGAWHRNRFYKLRINTTEYVYDSFDGETRTATVPETNVSFVENDYKGDYITGNASGGKLWRNDITNLDDGVAIPITLELPTVYPGGRIRGGIAKPPTALRMEIFRNGNHSLTVTQSKDNEYDTKNITQALDTVLNAHEWDTGKWGTAKWDGLESEDFIDVSLSASKTVGRALRFKISETSKGFFRLKGLTLLTKGKAN